MNKCKIIGGMLLAMGMVGSAAGAEAGDKRFYAGASIGEASADACDELKSSGATSCDDSDTGWKIFGGYQLTENFAAEGAWVDLGEVSATGPGGSAGIEIDGVMIDAKGILPINDQFGVFGKLGFIMWNADGTGGISGTDDDGTDLAYGLGAHYMFNEQLGIVGEWERFDLDGEDVDLLSAGAIVKF